MNNISSNFDTLIGTPIRNLVSKCAVAVERYDLEVAALSRSESAAIQGVALSRRVEFAAGRLAARRALAEIGFVNAEIPMADDRSPRWPPGTVGSISHTADLAIAVVARITDVIAIGIDIEKRGSVQIKLWPLILVESEIAWIARTPEGQHESWATLIFAAKEAFYKLQYPITHAWIDFKEVEVTILPNKGTFRLRPLKAISMCDRVIFHGKFVMLETLTAAVLELLPEK
jgi:4'-phosphopantetheinyl transferase EntD